MDNIRHNLPVLLLHNTNPAWAPEEILENEEDAATLSNALCELGHPVEVVTV